MNTAAAWLALIAYLAFAFRWWRKGLASLSKRLGDWTVLLVFLPYLLATNLRPAPLHLLHVVIYVALPTILLRLRPRDAKPFDLLHVLAILSIWVPIELDLFALFVDLVVPSAGLRDLVIGFDLLPGVDALLLPGVSLPIGKLTAILLALYLFLVRDPLEGIGFSFRLRRADAGHALLGLLGYAVVGLPIGLGLGFLRLNVVLPDLTGGVLSAVSGYLVVALPEELLFRGIIQNLLRKRWRRSLLVLPIAAILFGLSHLNNATPGFPVPNWAYALMATLAGLAYGWVWQRSKRVTVSAITHATVNLVWSVLFH